jgi:hypothetical protein
MSDIAKASLPQWCIDIIANPPRSGEGFHNWLFRAARALWKCGRIENDIRAILENAADGCGRRVTAHEIDDAIKNSQTNGFQVNPANQGDHGQRLILRSARRQSLTGTGFPISGKRRRCDWKTTQFIPKRSSTRCSLVIRFCA